MHGRTNAGGGISPFAFIFATYPAGSVCTCTDGSRTLKLKDTSGYGVFYPPYAGTWIVTATDGNSETSQTVEITSEGQNVSVELSYGTLLYKEGNEYTDITGGWAERFQDGTGGSVTVESSRILMNANKGASGNGSIVYAGPGNLIDLTEFSILKAKMIEVSGGSSGSLAIANKIGGAPVAEATYTELRADAETEITLDISAITGTKAVYAACANGGAVAPACAGALLECRLMR